MALVHTALLPRRLREYLPPAIRPRIRNPQPRRQNRPHGHALFDWHGLIESYAKAGRNEAPHAGRGAVGNSRNRIATRYQIGRDRDLVFDCDEFTRLRGTASSELPLPGYVKQLDQLIARQ